MHQVGAGVLGPVFRGYDPQTDRTVALKSFPLDITPEQAAEFAEELQRLASLDLNHPSLIAPRGAGVEGHTAFLVEDYFAAESIDTAIRQYGPAPAPDAVRLIGQLAGSLDFAAAVGVHHGALHPRDVLVAPREVRMTGIGVAAALEGVGFRAAARRPYSAPERVEGGEPTLAADVYALAVMAYELLTGRRPAAEGDALHPELGSVAAAEPAALAEVFARAFSLRPEDRYPSALAFAGALKHALTAQPIDATGDHAKEAQAAERPRSRRPRTASKVVPRPTEAGQPSEAEVSGASVPVAEAFAAVDATRGETPAPGDEGRPATAEARAAERGADVPSDQSGVEARAATSRAEADGSEARAAEEARVADEARAAEEARAAAVARADEEIRARAETPERLFAPEPELPAPPPLTMDDLDLRSEESDLPLLDRAEEPVVPSGPSILGEAAPSSDQTPPPADAAPREWKRPSRPAAEAAQEDVPQRRRPARTTTQGTGGFGPPMPQKRRVSGVALLLMLVFGVLLGLGAGYYFAVRDTSNASPTPGDAAAPSGQPASQPPAATPQGQVPSSPTTSGPPPLEGTVPAPSSPTAPPASAAGSTPGTTTGQAAEPDSQAKARGAEPSPEVRRKATARPAAPRPKAKAAAARETAGAAAGAERTRRQVFEGSLSVISKPTGARVFVDGHPVGTTPMTLPRLSAGSHVVRLERDGYSAWSAAIQVVAGEQNRVTASLEQRSSR